MWVVVFIEMMFEDGFHKSPGKGSAGSFVIFA
jgi:hypothetical protein